MLSFTNNFLSSLSQGFAVLLLFVVFLKLMIFFIREVV